VAEGKYQLTFTLSSFNMRNMAYRCFIRSPKIWIEFPATHDGRFCEQLCDNFFSVERLSGKVK
jgi:hypothetical protein